MHIVANLFWLGEPLGDETLSAAVTRSTMGWFDSFQ